MPEQGLSAKKRTVALSQVVAEKPVRDDAVDMEIQDGNEVGHGAWAPPGQVVPSETRIVSRSRAAKPPARL